jgi:MYND finger
MTGCATCQSPRAMQYCDRCYSEIYCDTLCQRGHWKEHKKVCRRRNKSERIWTLHVNDTVPTTYWKIEETDKRADYIIDQTDDFTIYMTGECRPKPTMLAYMFALLLKAEIPEKTWMWYHEIVFVFHANRPTDAFLSVMERFAHLDCRDCVLELETKLAKIYNEKFLKRKG